MAERLPPGVYDTENIRLPYLPNGLEPNGIQYPNSNGEHHSRSDSNSSYLASQISGDSTINGVQGISESHRDSCGSYETNQSNQAQGLLTPYGRDRLSDLRVPNGNQDCQARNSGASEAGNKGGPFQDGENGSKSRITVVPGNVNQVEAEWIEQYEPGVYITLVALRDGTRDLKRVRFRYLILPLF